MSAPTSQKNIALSKPTGIERISPYELGYFQARNKNRVYEIVLTEFENSGLTQTELANRLNKGRDRICRLLGAPGNWTLDTVSDLLFAISGSELEYSISHPLEAAPKNQRAPEWLDTRYLASTAPCGPETQSVASTSDTRARMQIHSAVQ